MIFVSKFGGASRRLPLRVFKFNDNLEFPLIPRHGRSTCQRQLHTIKSRNHHTVTSQIGKGNGLVFTYHCRPTSTLAHLRSLTTSNNVYCVWDIFRRASFGSYALVSRPGEVSAPQPVPPHVACPSHAHTGEPSPGPTEPEVKEAWQVEAMRAAGTLAAQIQATVGHNIKAGMTTDDIDKLVHRCSVAGGDYPSPLNYMGFPKSVCTCVNNVACHGIPDDRPLVDGDIVSVDVTVYHNGHHGDCCETYLVGDVDQAGRHLVEAARRCRDEAIALCRPGVPFNEIGATIENVAEMLGVTVVPCFVGHGIGHYFHGPPDIYHSSNDYPGTMEAGMTFTIEPIVAQGSHEVIILEDGWTAIMTDNGRAAQFEHTILITEDGHEILTLP